MATFPSPLWSMYYFSTMSNIYWPEALLYTVDFIIQHSTYQCQQGEIWQYNLSLAGLQQRCRCGSVPLPLIWSISYLWVENTAWNSRLNINWRTRWHELGNTYSKTMNPSFDIPTTLAALDTKCRFSINANLSPCSLPNVQWNEQQRHSILHATHLDCNTVVE